MQKILKWKEKAFALQAQIDSLIKKFMGCKTGI